MYNKTNECHRRHAENYIQSLTDEVKYAAKYSNQVKKVA